MEMLSAGGGQASGRVWIEDHPREAGSRDSERRAQLSTMHAYIYIYIRVHTYIDN